VSVSFTVALPAQPPSGSTDIVPLGGDGFVAPESATHFSGIIQGDGSGGFASIQVGFDPRWVQLVSYVSLKIVGIAADVNAQQEIRVTAFETFIVTNTAPYKAITGITGSPNNLLWTPPAILLSAGASPLTNGPYYRFYTDNPGVGNNVQVSMRVYNFNKRARELVPLDKLMSSLSVASTMI